MNEPDLEPIRLREARIPQDVASAVAWYQDPEVLHFSEGDGVQPYDETVVTRMYEHFRERGTMFIVEVELSNGKRFPIGDAALCHDTLPIVIGDPRYRSRGYGRRVLEILIDTACALGWSELRVGKIFEYNDRSLRLYASAGFEVSGRSIDDAGRSTAQMTLKMGDVCDQL